MTDVDDRSSTTENAAERIAVALEYAFGSDHAPSVVASGRGELAAHIIQVAEANGVPVRPNGDLASLLSAMRVGDEIPPEAFAAVAEILAYLYRLDGRLGAGAQANAQADAHEGGARR